MFEELSQRFEAAAKSLRGQAKISETNIEKALKDVRRALLAADVSLSVVKPFLATVREQALGADVVRGVSPDQQFIKLVHDALVEVMGGANVPLNERPQVPASSFWQVCKGPGKRQRQQSWDSTLKRSACGLCWWLPMYIALRPLTNCIPWAAR